MINLSTRLINENKTRMKTPDGDDPFPWTVRQLNLEWTDFRFWRNKALR
jgi:hypothetical protein